MRTLYTLGAPSLYLCLMTCLPLDQLCGSHLSYHCILFVFPLNVSKFSHGAFKQEPFGKQIVHSFSTPFIGTLQTALIMSCDYRITRLTLLKTDYYEWVLLYNFADKTCVFKQIHEMHLV
jgi:hypothetical protein